MGLHRRQQRIEARGQRRDLVQCAGGQHRVEPRIDPLVERSRSGARNSAENSLRRQQRRQALAMPIGQWAPGRLDHLERPGDPDAVARLQALGGDRIALLQFGMQRLDTVALQP